MYVRISDRYDTPKLFTPASKHSLSYLFTPYSYIANIVEVLSYVGRPIAICI